MMNIFVINRKKDVDRKNYIEKHFSEIGIEDYSFFEAIEGTELSEEFVKKCRTLTSKIMLRGRELRIGEIGCALSHLSIYKKIVENSLTGALIFEDDVDIKSNDILDIVDSNVVDIKNIPAILNLGEIKKKYANKILGDDMSEIKGCIRTHAYYINQLGAKNMLKAFGEYPYMPIDQFKQLRIMGALRLFAFKKPICLADVFDSTIENIDGDGQRKVRKSFFKKRFYELLKLFVEYITLPLKFKKNKTG